MTNGAFANRVKATDGDKDGEKRVPVTSETSIVRFEPGQRSELVPGAKIVAIVQDHADGSKEALRSNLGRDGITLAV